MTSLGATLAFGFLLGMRHAADTDHVVAVSAIVARTRRFGAAWLLGAVWGLGHTATIFLVGAAIILLKVTIPPRLGLAMEFAVGMALAALGALNIAGRGMGSMGLRRHSHPHDHDDPEHRHQLLEPGPSGHAHEHAHLEEPALPWLERSQIARSAAMGLVHGLAGSASVALLALATISNSFAAMGYLAVFGLGTLAGMLLLSALMELSMALLARWWRSAAAFLRISTGLLSVLCGLWVMYQTGFIDGLFLSD